MEEGIKANEGRKIQGAYCVPNADVKVIRLVSGYYMRVCVHMFLCVSVCENVRAKC